VRVIEAKTKGAGPDVLLIAEQVVQEVVFGWMWNIGGCPVSRAWPWALTVELRFPEESSKKKEEQQLTFENDGLLSQKML
jgi:hypothetical protein